MAWENIDSNKATDKQIKYAEALLESYYGDICYPIYTMSKQDISKLIDETKKKCQEKGINYHNSTTEQVHGTEEGDRRIYTCNPTPSTYNYSTFSPYNFAIPTYYGNIYNTPVETAITSRIMTDEELREDINRNALYNIYTQPNDFRYKIDLIYKDIVFSEFIIVTLGDSTNFHNIVQVTKNILKEKAFQHFRGTIAIANTILRNTEEENLLHQRYANGWEFYGLSEVDTLRGD